MTQPLRFAANLSTMFTELPFLERFSAAREAGFAAVEVQFPYEETAQAIRAELDANRLALVLFNPPPGDWEAGERGLGAIPGREADFASGLAVALDYAETVDCRLIHVMAGVLPPDVTEEQALDTFAGNLRQAAPLAADRGVGLVIEPINRRDIPGYILSHTDTARQLIDTVGADNLGLQFDIYHRQVAQGDVVTALRDYADITRHIQIANPPGRTEPGNGELDYDFIFPAIVETGYTGWIGCEYRPAGATADSLAWFAPYRCAPS